MEYYITNVYTIDQRLTIRFYGNLILCSDNDKYRAYKTNSYKNIRGLNLAAVKLMTVKVTKLPL
jgi:hypothetical protein